MAVTLVNLTGTLTDLVGANFDARRTKVWIETNVEGDVVIDSTGDEIHLGNAAATVGTDGAFTFTDLVATNSTTNPTAFQYQVHIAYPVSLPQLANNGNNASWDSGWFSLTATSDLADVAAEQYVPPTWMTTATATLQGYVDEGKAYRDNQALIAGLTGEDTAVAALVNQTGPTPAESATHAALSASIADSPAYRNGDLLPAQDLEYLDTATVQFFATLDGEAWGHGPGAGSLYRSTDDGDTWALVVPNGFFNSVPNTMLKMGNGEVLIMGDAGLYRSTGWPTNPATATWTLAATPTNDGVNTRANFTRFVLDVWDNLVLLGEYVTPRNNARYLRVSTDHGATFTNVFDLNALPGGDVGAHYHGVAIDPWHTGANPRIWFTHGDGPKGIYYSDNLGTTWTEFTGGVNRAFDPTTNNAMTIRATPAGMVLTTDSNSPDGMYRILRQASDADMVLERMAIIPFENGSGSLIGFGGASWRDPETNLVWTAFGTTYQTGMTKPLPGYLFVSDGYRGAIAWTTPQTSTTVGQSMTPQNVGVTASGKIMLDYKGPDATLRVVRLNQGGRGGRPFYEMNAGNALTGRATRESVAIGPYAEAVGASVVIGSKTLINGASAGDAVVIGAAAQGVSQGVTIGRYADSKSTRTIAIGYQAIAGAAATDSVLIGANTAAEIDAVVIGSGSSSTSATGGTVLIGKGLAAGAVASPIAIGKGITLTGGTSPVAIGQNSQSKNANTVAVGSGANVGGHSAVGIGSGPLASGTSAVAIGRDSVASGNYSMALGQAASASAHGSVAIGRDAGGTSAATTTQDEIALGTASHTTKIAGYLRIERGQTTVGAAGAASALPATPTKYLSVKDSTGTEYVFPVYAKA